MRDDERERERRREREREREKERERGERGCHARAAVPAGLRN